MSAWISVRKRLPRLQMDILYVVRTAGVKPYVRKGVRGEDGQDYFWCDEDGDFDEQGNDGDESYVSHWMPLPRIPRTTRHEPVEKDGE